MKSFSKILFIVFGLIMANHSLAQTVVAGGSPLVFPCGGGIVDLTALGESTTPVFGDDFNGGTVAAGWAASSSADFSNPCGAPVDGTTYLWMGSTATAPRAMTTASVDVSCGGTVCFDFKFVCESCGDSAPCEGADFYNEGVSLQYSTDGGATFTDFAYFAPNGDILTAYPGAGVTFPSASGATPFTTWGNYCFPIPAAGETGATIFRLYQWGSSSALYDHWGIDNFYVYADPCAPYYYDWDHIPGFPDSPDVSTVVTESGTYTVCYTNGITSVCDDVSVIVDEIDISSLTFVAEPCLGDDAATLSVTVAGGAAPYSYILTGPTPSTNTTGNFSGLAPGLYTITVDDGAGCITDSSFTIPPGIPCCSVTAAGTDALCFGEATGSALATPGAGGTPPFAFAWFDAGGAPLGITTAAAGGLAAGDYSVTMTDASGCVVSADVTVGEPTAVTAGTTLVNPLCFGDCDGSITVTGAAGGTPGYTYNINGGLFQAPTLFPGLCDGDYTIIVKDANGCELTITPLTLTEPTDLTLTEISTVPATCGMANGEIDVDAGGGTPAYSYDLAGTVNATGDFTGLAAGVHTIVVTDGNGCTETLNVTVDSEDGPIPFTDVLNDVTCNGGLNGSATIGVGGGLAPYTFALDGGLPQASNSFPAISAGPHTVEVTDANGCVGSIDFVIGEPTALTYGVTITDALCFGSCDGEIDIDAAGATPPYTYSDDAGATFGPSDILTGLCAGPVNVVVKDANGCLANSLEAIGEPTAVTSTADHVEPSCFGLSDGEISFVPGGGTPGYTFSIDGGATFGGPSPITGVAAGDYDLVVMDANGCQFILTETVNQPPPFSFTYIANDPSNCGANDGSFEIIATDGLAPYDYSIDGGATWEPDGLFEDLFSGLYTLVVEDDNGCIDSVYEALSDNVMTSSTVFANDATCFNSCNGSLGVDQMFGAAPFTYTHSYLGVETVSAFPNFFGLCAGTHYVTIEDDGDCIAIETIVIGEPDTITFTPTKVDVTCPAGSDGEIDFGAVIGGDGGAYDYSIDGGGTFFPGPVFTGLPIGTYDVVARDGNGCLGATTITLVEPDPITAVVIETDLLCNGDNSGVIQVVGDGGTGPYTYTIGATTNATGVFATMAAGAYVITVTDALGCTEVFPANLAEPAVLTAAYTISDATCNGVCDGEIDVDALGGTTPYLYSSDGGVILGSADVLTGLCAGDHDIYVEDDNGCTVLSTETIAEPTPLSMTLVMNPATCGLNNADVTITAAGGTPGYMYSNDAGATFQVPNFFGGLAATNYTLVLEDNNGCQIDSIISLSADDLPVIDNVFTIDPLCNGGVDGSIEIISSGGVGVHQYSIGGAYQASNIFPGLGAGVYTVFVQDENGCISSQDVELLEPPLLTYGAVVTDLLCNGDNTGSIVLTPAGGTAPYQYSIDNGVTFSGAGTFSFIAAGAYDIVVQDANGCQATGVENVNEPAILDWTSFIITNPTCFGDCDGTITTTVAGGTAPYSYFWTAGIEDPADETSGIGACDGIYSVSVSDANGCDLDSLSFVVTEPVPVPITGVITTDLLCNSDASGILEIDAPTAVAYDLPGTAYVSGDVTGIYTGLDAGNYDVVAIDPDGCEAMTNVTIYEPTPLVLDMPSDWPTCFGSTVTVQTYVVGGTVPYTYSWTNDLDATVETTSTFDAVITAPITFTVVVTDANGCVIGPDSYNVLPSPTLAVTAAAIPDAMICLGESVDLDADATGGQLIDFGPYLGYSYSWDTGVLGDTTEVITVSPTVPTDYTVTVTDFCGQVIDAVVSIGIHPEPVIDVTGGGNGCAPELVSFTNPSHVAGSTCLWDFGDGTTSTDCGAADHVYINPGCYDVSLTVTSDQGCTNSDLFDDLVCIYDDPEAGFYWTPNSPSILDPTVEIINTAINAETYEYNLSGFTSFEENPIHTFPPVEEQTEVEVCQYVVSAEGCVDTLCQTITIHEEILFYVPNAFTPDGDEYNEEFKPIFTTGVDPYQYHLTIFNRWGEIVFESFDYDYGWSGAYGNQGLVEDGVYIWQIEFGEKLTDKKQKHRGHVTVLK